LAALDFSEIFQPTFLAHPSWLLETVKAVVGVVVVVAVAVLVLVSWLQMV